MLRFQLKVSASQCRKRNTTVVGLQETHQQIR